MNMKKRNPRMKNYPSASSIKVYRVMQKLSSDGFCCISYRRLAICSKFCRSTIIKAICELVRLGWIRKYAQLDANNNHCVNTYQLLRRKHVTFIDD